MLNSSRNSNLAGRLKWYALAGGAVVAACPAAQAGVISYADVQTVSWVDGAPNNRLDLDMNNDGINDFSFMVNVNAPSGYASESVGLSFYGVVAGVPVSSAFSAASGQPDLLGVGSPIGPSSTWSSKATTSPFVLSDSSGTGNFHGASGYLGVQFFSDAATQTHYGWVYLTASEDIANLTSSVTVSGWGYEDTADTAIDAGATAVPEPSSMALFALGAAGIGAVLRRRRSVRP